MVLTWKVTVSVTRTTTKLKKLNYWKGNYAELSARLEEINWDSAMSQLAVEEKWIFFRDTVLELAKEFVPEKRECKKKKAQWISKETVRAMKGRTEALREYVNNRCKSNYRKFVMIRNKVNKMIRSDKESYNQRILDSFKGNPKNSMGT